MPYDADPQRQAALAAALADLNAERFRRVTERCARLLRADPDDLDALLLAGLAAGALGDAAHAAGLLHRVAAARPDAAHPCRDLKRILWRIARMDLIEPQFRAALRLAPTDPALCYAFADYLHEARREAEAIEPLTACVRQWPDFLPAHNLLGIVLAAVGRTEEAMQHLRAALVLDHAQPAVWANLGLLLKDDGRFDEALAAYDTAVALAPEDAQIRVNRVVARLSAGRWAEAWPDYEWRLKLLRGAPLRMMPMLSELPGIEGLTILARHEDGFGDTLHFARYLPLLAARGADVVARVPVSLMRLMQTVPGVSEVIAPYDVLPERAYDCPFFSMPRVFETDPDDIPAPIPYLHADPALAAAWADRLPAGAVRVGLVWAGQARPELPGFDMLDARRSIRLATLAPLASVPGVTFISLQYGPEAAQAGAPPACMALHDPMGEVTDFADTAAIIANLDLTISVDSAVVHLAGAMGRPVFLLDRYDHCWRWLHGRSDSPWYPTMRIFRQDRIGDWTPVVQRVAAALREQVASVSRDGAPATTSLARPAMTRDVDLRRPRKL